MDVRRLIRNWLYPALAAAGAAAIAAYQGGCMELDCMLEPALYAGAAFLLTKFNGLAGRDQGWFSHDKGDGTDPHRH